MAARCHLHLAGRLGFSLDEKARRRAGLDYWDKLIYSLYDTFDEMVKEYRKSRFYFFSKKAERSLYDIRFKRSDVLVFGCETYGLPDNVVEKYHDRLFRIPMPGDVRSLNLANSVAVVVFEGLRQMTEGREA